MTGFYETKSIRPGGFALVVSMHAAAFAGLILIKTDIVPEVRPITDIFYVAPPKQDPDPQPQPPREQPRQPASVIDSVPPIVDRPVQGPVVDETPLPPTQFSTAQPAERVELAGIPELPPPVRVEAQIDPRYADQLQPPYPPREESAQRNGTVRVRVTIGTDGRVKAVQRISATSDEFWRVTERHALARWRFRPATLDGRPIESTKVMNLVFRIEA